MKLPGFGMKVLCAGIVVVAVASAENARKEALNKDGSGPLSVSGDVTMAPDAAPAQAGDLWIRGGIVNGIEHVVMTWTPAKKNLATVGPNTSMTTAVEEIPARFALGWGVPNPFNHSTRLSFDLPEPSRVRLGIYDVSGRLVNQLVADDLGAGRHQRHWDGSDAARRILAPGVYLVRMEAYGLRSGEKMTAVRKVMMVR